MEELVKLEEAVGELDVALLVGSSALGLLLEVLPLDCAIRDCGWRCLDLILEGHVAPQQLALLVVVVEDVEPRRLVPLGVDALVLLLLGDKDVVVLELGQKRLDLIEDGGLAHRLALACGHEVWTWREVGLVQTCTFARVEHLHVDDVVVVLELVEDVVRRRRAHDAWR